MCLDFSGVTEIYIVRSFGKKRGSRSSVHGLTAVTNTSHFPLDINNYLSQQWYIQARKFPLLFGKPLLQNSCLSSYIFPIFQTHVLLQEKTETRKHWWWLDFSQLWITFLGDRGHFAPLFASVTKYHKLSH